VYGVDALNEYKPAASSGSGSPAPRHLPNAIPR
jgi:hypothetical protein